MNIKGKRSLLRSWSSGSKNCPMAACLVKGMLLSRDIRKGEDCSDSHPASLERRRQFKAGTCRISIYKESAAIIEKQCVLL